MQRGIAFTGIHHGPKLTRNGAHVGSCRGLKRLFGPNRDAYRQDDLGANAVDRITSLLFGSKSARAAVAYALQGRSSAEEERNSQVQPCVYEHGEEKSG